MKLDQKFYIQLLQMKKGVSNEKIIETKGVSKSFSQIKFNLSAHNLACFKGKDKMQLIKTKVDGGKDIKWLSQIKPLNFGKQNQQVPSTERSRAISCSSNFNEQVVIMQYDNMDVYIDNSTQKKSNSSKSKSSSRKGKKSDSDDGTPDQFLQKCVRAATQQTDNSSNQINLSAYHMTPPSLTPRSSQADNYYEMYNYYQPKQKPVRKRQTVTMQQSKRFVIDYDTIENCEKTTVMVKNIPNKYTQQMLLQQFTVNYENKFDFFYLPIDKDNECNVGYAFVNFINTTFLKQFYLQFHAKKWKQYKSPKICNICYARYQGTLQLADHFKHAKVMNQKDRRLKPLIGVNEANRIKDIKQIIKNQRNQQ